MQRESRLIVVAALALGVVSSFAVAAKKTGKTYIDPAAAKADADFMVQGEYAGDHVGYQVIALSEGKFAVVECEGGLPGDGFNGKTKTHTNVDAAKVKHLVGDAKRVERSSPTAGEKAPDGAIVLFDGSKDSLSNWEHGKLDGDMLCEGTQTAKKFGSFKLHLEFREPFKPFRHPSNQDRGNSGIYIHNHYETQVIDTFGLHYNDAPESQWKQMFEHDLGFKTESDRTQWCASEYHYKTPTVSMCYPPLQWQTYDIEFHAPKFDAGGKKIADAHITVIHNGVKVQDHTDLPHGTGAGQRFPETPTGPIVLQGHGNPVRYRNIWIKPLD